ncbi:MAG: hypothetical protein COA65_10175 [Rhodospirillaceae bacterium]|nr:MAG: hypothetical protein COA65_10175 [Rhodospirillaceae bacterium]
MPYVQRNISNKIIGVFSMPQAKIPKEFLPDDHAELIAFNDPPATVADVKAAAGAKIVAAYPAWKQRNMNMRATELQEIRIDGGTLSSGEQAEVVALKAVAAWIKTVRAASGTIEKDIGTQTVADMEADGRWPAART